MKSVEKLNALQYKRKFLEQNADIAEIPVDETTLSIGDFHRIDEVQDEVWFLQCPKGLDIRQFENQKIKLPGRTNTNELEAVAVELVSSTKHAFGYCNRKGKYALRTLPVTGSIIVRKRLKANESVTEEKIAAICPPEGRVPAPSLVKVRHPLLGAQFESKLKLSKEISRRLKSADENSCEITGERRRTRAVNSASLTQTNGVKSCDDNDGKITNKKSKHKKVSKKRKNSESVAEAVTITNGDNDVSIRSSKHKLKKIKKEPHVVSDEEDLKWLTNL